MDTRTKIVGFEEAIALSEKMPVRWVTGHFDPLLSDHVRRLREFIADGHKLIVVVTNPADPLLPQRARAELVAALAGVDYVVLKNGSRPSEEPEDEELKARFVEHVRNRHGRDSA